MYVYHVAHMLYTYMVHMYVYNMHTNAPWCTCAVCVYVKLHVCMYVRMYVCMYL